MEAHISSTPLILTSCEPLPRKAYARGGSSSFSATSLISLRQRRSKASQLVPARNSMMLTLSYVAHSSSISFLNEQVTPCSCQVQARGPRANTTFVSASLGPDSLSETGFVIVRPTLQLKSHDDIFAAGDVIEWKEQKQGAKASAHGVLAAGNILAFLNKGKLKEYKGATEMILLSNGKVGRWFSICSMPHHLLTVCIWDF